MIILRTITLICFLLISHLSFTEYRDKNYQARLQDVMKARKLMDKKRERDKINDLAQELAQEMIIIDTGSNGLFKLLILKENKKITM